MDSIGGVNPALAWAFDQRGRLKSDTSFTGGTARATSYAYDGFERPTTTTDALGTWTVRYEADRGYADTLITPYADTVTYTFDARDRAVGPYVSSGTQHARVPSWNPSGALRTLTNSVTTSPSYVTGKWDRKVFPDDPLAALGPVWTEQHGAGAGVDSLQDSLAFDGWERLTSWVGFTNGTAIARDTFRFDRVGNIQTTAGAESYDVTTGRLFSRTDTAGTWSYTYDRAGNLVQADQGSVTWVYGYDALNRLRSARKNGAIVARYAYDVAGRRIVKRATTKLGAGPLVYTRFVYRGANVAFETDSAGTIGLRYTWGAGADDLVAVRDGFGNHFYVVQDKLRSVRGLVRRDGSWAWSQRFGPYGTVVATAQDTAGVVTLRYGWTGREFDVETGWYYFRARYYDPGARRFVQEDPIGQSGGENVYAYVGGNPVDRRDPSGMAWDYAAYAMDPNDAHLFWNCFTPSCNEAWSGGGLSFNGAPVTGAGSRLVAPTLLDLMQRQIVRDRLFALRAQARSRRLDVYERMALGELCTQLDCTRVRIVEGGDLILLFTDAITLGNTTYMRESAYSISLLAHELTHVVQYQSWGGFEYYVRGLSARVWDVFGDPYSVQFPLTKPFSAYGMEQQAFIVQSCYQGSAAACNAVFGR